MRNPHRQKRPSPNPISKPGRARRAIADGRKAGADIASPRFISAITRTIRPRLFCCGWRAAAGWTGLPPCGRWRPFRCPDFAACTLARPLLAVPRAALRDYLKARGQDWLEDPMNSEARFARAASAPCLPALAEAGLTAAPHRRCRRPSGPRPRGAGPGDRGGAGAGLPSAAGAGVLLLDPEALAAAPREIGLRALAALLRTVSAPPTGPDSRPWRGCSTAWPRRPALGGGATLHGCRIGPGPASASRLSAPRPL